MRTIEVKIYQFDELSEEAKKNAIEYYRNNMLSTDFLMDDLNKTLDRFCEIFSIKWQNFDPCEMYRSEWKFQMEDEILQLSGFRLAKYIWNNFKTDIFQGKYYGRLVDTFKDGSKIEKSEKHPAGLRHVIRHSKVFLDTTCPLTGMAYDNSVLDPIYKFLDKPDVNTNFEDLLIECLHSLAKDVCSEIEYRDSDEAIKEDIKANEYEFTEDGETV